MKIGILLEPSGGGIGGAEFLAGVLAEDLQSTDSVTLIHRKPELVVESWQNRLGLNLTGVQIQRFPWRLNTRNISNPMIRRRAMASEDTDLTAGYDLFVSIVHSIPPTCYASRGIMIVLFPLHPPAREIPLSPMATSLRGLKRKLQKHFWQRPLASYEKKTAISQYTRRWTHRLWGIDCEVLYPPIETEFPSAVKESVILSVGRFVAGHYGKRQLEMVRLFTDLIPKLPGWRYWSAGGVSQNSEQVAYFQEVQQATSHSEIQLLPNISHSDLRERFSKAKIFWHAMGYGRDQDNSPEQSEHFGISTAEAMAAGCVPVVINRGGQPEIVEHGKSGFLWNTLEELAEFTLLLAHDEPLRLKMAAEAKSRSDMFSREQMCSRFRDFAKLSTNTRFER